MVHVILGILLILAGVGFGVVVFFGNMMSDNPSAVDFSPLWWVSLPLIGVGVACIWWW